MNGAIYVEGSHNIKIAGSKKVDATYCSIKSSCPKSCPLKDAGCYALTSYVGITVNRLESESKENEPIDTARAEVNAIDSAYRGGYIPDRRDLRLHVSGDSRTVKGTILINSAIKRWKKRGGGDCWSYTHSWRNVPKSAWSAVSILASVDNISDVKQARKQGYAPAIVVPSFEGTKAFQIKGSKTKFIPCPAQTKPGGKEIACVDCRLCFDANRLYKMNMGIAFEAHGTKKNEIKRRLEIIK